MECKKTKFATEADALFYVNKLHKTSNRETKPVRAYLCTTCLRWHLTKQNDAESLRVKRLENELAKKNELLAKHEKTIFELRQQLKTK